MNRRGFLKSISLAPLVAFVPGILWVPEQTLTVPELAPAMAPLIEAVAAENSIYGFWVNEMLWRREYVRNTIITDGLSYFPRGAQVVIIADPQMSFGRFMWRGAGLPQVNGEVQPLAQTWVNGEPLEPQLWLA